MNFRSATDSDLQTVISWIRNPSECLQWAGPDVGFPIPVDALKTQIAYSPDNSYCLDEKGRAAAFGQLLKKGEGHFHLARIIVAPHLRGMGHGREICLRIMEQAPASGSRLLTLNVNENNLAARRLYRNLGFQPVSPIDGKPLPADVVHMRWHRK